MSIALWIEHNGEKRKVPLGIKAIFIGRASSCHIPIQDPMISSKHLAIKVSKEGKAVIKDLESTNGTFINDCKILEAYIYLEDDIRIGSVKMWLEPSTMNQKEKELHTREGQKTNITFIKLKEYEQQKDDSQYRNIRPPNEEKLQTSTAKSELHDKVVEKSKQIASRKENTELGVDNVIEMDESTGQTKMIKIDKKETKKKASLKNKTEEKEEGIADKILKFFKK